MSMRPIDLKAAIGSSYEISRAGSADASKAGMQNAYFGRQLDKEITRSEQLVRESDKMGAAQLDSKRDSQNQRERSKKREKDKSKNLEMSDELVPFSGGRVDIKV